MVVCKICLATLLLSFHAANSYILLTANLDDVHAIAKQIAASPVASQLNKIIRRASGIFSEHVQKSDSQRIHQRTDEKLDEDGTDNFDIWKPDPKAKEYNQIALRSRSDSDTSDVDGERSDNIENRVERRQSGDDLVELGRNASFYLKSIKKIFENV